MRIFTAILLVVCTMCSCAPIKNSDEYSETKLLMDTVCTIKAGGAAAQTAVKAAFDRIEEIDAEVSYFSDTSDVTAVNSASSGEAVAVGAHTIEIIKTALAVSKASEGAFDITVAPLKDLWNFQGGSHEPPAKGEIDALLPLTDYSQLTIDETARTVTKALAAAKIDLGGAAKGYAADCAAEVLKQNGAEWALIDLGGNVCVFGKNPARTDGRWIIGIQKPFKSGGEYAQTVTLSEGAVVTSGNYQRYFEWDGQLYHHILNPMTGYPSDSGISGASIVSDSALLADCLSTACMVIGEERGKELAESFGAELITE